MHRANGITRHQILASIKVHGAMTADGLGKELGISPVAVRQHLAGMESEGIVSTSVERRGLGRPVHRYSLTAAGDETFPRDYDGFANGVLDELQSSEGQEAVDRLFAMRNERIVAGNQGRVQGKPLAARVQEIARIQSDGGYMAVTEEVDGGVRLIQYNCAICQIARSHPSVCEHERRMIAALAGQEAVVERREHILAGDHFCSYFIAPASPS